MLQPDGGGFQGIDPAMLSQLIKVLTSGVNSAQPVASSYLGQFTRLGLDTSAVNKLLADYAWASNQQPMLQRRYSLASHQPPGSWSGGWTGEGAGSLRYASTGAAKKAGAAAAKRMQAYLDARDWPGVQKELDALNLNQGDADYMAAFFSQLGPAGLYQLSMLAMPGNNKKDAQEVQDVVGNSLATASYEMPLTMSFLQGIAPADDPEETPTAELPGGWDSGMLAPFLTQGEYSDQWLKTIAPTVLYRQSVEMGEPLPGGYDAIFQAIANNPGFAAEFYQQNTDVKTGHDQLSQYMTDPLLYHDLASGPGFGKFLEAATIPPPGATDTKLFTQNAANFVQLFGGGNTDTSSTVRQAMAAVAVQYFSDIKGTVTAAAPGAGSTMGLTSTEWGSFVQNAMHDKTAAAFLMSFYANWSSAQPTNNVPQDGAGDGPLTPTRAGYWYTSSQGLLDYFFASNYQAAGATAGDGSGIKDTLISALSAGGATLLTSVVFGPEAGAFVITADMLKDAGKDAFSNAAEDTLNDIGSKLTEGGPDAGAGGLDANLTNIQQQWSHDVYETWRNSQSTPGHSNFPTVKYNGVTYNGDPLSYEQQYSTAKDPTAGYFMNSNGTIKPKLTATQLAAYNAWLQDPAVSSQVAPYFTSRNGGAVMAFYDDQMSGGGGAAGN